MFSIIMPAYNAEQYIAASIDSVLLQIYQDYELIIIDDASTDNTKNIVREYMRKDSRIKLLENHVNLGVAETRNRGVFIAKKPYISFLDSDDLWDSQKLMLFQEQFEKGANVLFSYYTRFKDLPENGKLVKAPLTVTYHKLLMGNCIGNLTGAYNSKVIGKIFQKNIKHEDYVMWLEILENAGKAFCIPRNLAYYRVHNYSVSANKLESLGWTWDIYRSELKLGYFSCLFYMFSSAVQSMLKRII